ncbi:centromere protein R isoform X3 [Cavia porcellus]|uniref:centromere protein R isoform X3 n=1 Tax=Cavia porcellus TaxID=10141 RepID=UPI002FE280D9
MRVRRSLKLNDQLDENSFGPSKIRKKRSITAYSPTTGTCQMSPFSPTSSEKKDHTNSPANGKRKKLDYLTLAERKECPPNDDDEFMVLFSKAERSAEKITETMQSLRSLQALKGNKEFENLIGASCASRFLRGEIKKTKELLTKVTKQKLLEKKSSELPHKELCHLDSYEFLKAILSQGSVVTAERLPACLAPPKPCSPLHSARATPRLTANSLFSDTPHTGSFSGMESPALRTHSWHHSLGRITALQHAGSGRGRGLELRL